MPQTLPHHRERREVRFGLRLVRLRFGVIFHDVAKLGSTLDPDDSFMPIDFGKSV